MPRIHASSWTRALPQVLGKNGVRHSAGRPHKVPALSRCSFGMSFREAVSPPLAHPQGVACTPEGCVGPGLEAIRRPSHLPSVSHDRHFYR